MKKVMIVEDDYSVRKYMKSRIAWEKNGYQLVGEAENGVQALEKIRNLQPDFIITDIQMPQMNGVELIRKLQEEEHPTKVVVLSFYEDFFYVRDAMKYGALDYILKHQLTEESLFRVLDEAQKCRENQHDQKMKEENRLMKRQIQNNLNEIKRRIFKDIELGMHEIEERKAFGIPEKDFTFLFICLKLQRDEDRKYDQGILEFAVCNITEEILRQSGECIACAYSEREYWILLWCNEKGRHAFLERSSFVRSRELLDQLKRYTDITAAAGIGRAEIDWMRAGHAMEDARDAADHIFYEGYGNIYKFGANDFTEKIDYPVREDTFLNLVQEKRDITPVLGKILERFENEKLRPHLFLRMADYLESSLELVRNQMEKYSGIYIGDKEVYNYKEWNYEEIREYLVQRGQEIDSFREKNLEKTYARKEINEAVKYIRLHYKEDLTLAELAEHVNLSRIYFSQLFKKETGMNLTDYIIGYRIEKAAGLLKESNKMVYEVAAMVGIPDQHYFNRLFKNLKGMTPAKFREQNASINHNGVQ